MKGDFDHRALLIAAFTSSVVSGGCTLVLDRDKQCQTDDDCKKFSASAVCINATCQHDTSTSEPPGADAGSPWGCLGKVIQPTSSAAQVVIQLPLLDMLTKKPVTTSLVRACAKMDVTCASPLGPTVMPDATGVATVTVPAGFDGYLEVNDQTPDAAAGFIPSLVFMNPAPLVDMRYAVIPLFSGAVIAQLAASQGNTVDPELGFMFAGALDCQFAPAAGVSWEPDRSTEATRRFFYVDGLPSEAAVVTDATGYGGLINAPTGTVRLFVKLSATGQTIGTASVFIRAGHISFVSLVPSP